MSNKHRMIIAFLIVCILVLFGIAARFEMNRISLEEEQQINYDINILGSSLHDLLTETIALGEGVIAFIKYYPDLDQEAFADYVESALDPSESMIHSMVAVKDTTIAFTYPLLGNESGIGVDLASIKGQKEEVLMVKNQNISLLVGPTILVEGGKALINRMPIRTEDDYWGQLSIVINYDELLAKAGIENYSENYYIRIKQLDEVNHSEHIIYSNIEIMDDSYTKQTIAVPNGHWALTFVPRRPRVFSPIFYWMILTALIVSVASGLIMRYLLLTNTHLNEVVKQRTQAIELANADLKYSLEHLKQTQEQLIQREKHATVGELVAGVTHEINTPLGVCVTANSFIEETSRKLSQNLADGKLKKSELVNGIDKLQESSQIISSNLQRAAKLVKNFKKMTSDQHFDEYEVIEMTDYLNYIVETISPAYKRTHHLIEVDVPEGIQLWTYPSALTQVLTNLLMNSLDHGFIDVEAGIVNIVVQAIDETVHIDYFDNGRGIPVNNQSKIFNPFYTTKREAGNTGLGMNIAYNVVTEKLHGSIAILDDVAKGVHFQIILPKKKID